jgi:predicted transcriptional regulator
MTDEWMNDARKIPRDFMGFIRKIVVRAIEEKGYSPEVVADMVGISRTAIYCSN